MTTLELLRNAMRLKIVSVGEAVLRQPARSLTAAEIRGAEIQQLIQHMRETVNDAPGVGLPRRRWDCRCNSPSSKTSRSTWPA